MKISFGKAFTIKTTSAEKADLIAIRMTNQSYGSDKVATVTEGKDIYVASGEDTKLASLLANISRNGLTDSGKKQDEINDRKVFNEMVKAFALKGPTIKLKDDFIRK